MARPKRINALRRHLPFAGTKKGTAAYPRCGSHDTVPILRLFLSHATRTPVTNFLFVPSGSRWLLKSLPCCDFAPRPARSRNHPFASVRRSAVPIFSISRRMRRLRLRRCCQLGFRSHPLHCCLPYLPPQQPCFRIWILNSRTRQRLRCSTP